MEVTEMSSNSRHSGTWTTKFDRQTWWDWTKGKSFGVQVPEITMCSKVLKASSTITDLGTIRNGSLGLSGAQVRDHKDRSSVREASGSVIVLGTIGSDNLGPRRPELHLRDLELSHWFGNHRERWFGTIGRGNSGPRERSSVREASNFLCIDVPFLFDKLWLKEAS